MKSQKLWPQTTIHPQTHILHTQTRYRYYITLNTDNLNKHYILFLNREKNHHKIFLPTVF